MSTFYYIFSCAILLTLLPLQAVQGFPGERQTHTQNEGSHRFRIRQGRHKQHANDPIFKRHGTQKSSNMAFQQWNNEEENANENEKENYVPRPPAFGRSIAHVQPIVGSAHELFKYLKHKVTTVWPQVLPSAPIGQHGRIGATATKLKNIFLFPSLVLIATEQGEDKFEAKCVGTLVAEHYVLTANNCVEEAKATGTLYSLMAHWDKDNTTHEFFVKRKIADTKKPSDYNKGGPKDGPKSNVALCELEEKIYACKNGPWAMVNLPKKDNDNFPSADKIKIVGYNSQQNPVQADFIENLIECNDPCPCPMPGTPDRNPNGWPNRDMTKTICGTKNLPSLEDTDRGHPLYEWSINDGDDDGGDEGDKWPTAHKDFNHVQTVIGIFSSNKYEGKTKASLYEKVGHHVKWIKDTIKIKNPDSKDAKGRHF